jgi:hypothetical protein
MKHGTRLVWRLVGHHPLNSVPRWITKQRESDGDPPWNIDAYLTTDQVFWDEIGKLLLPSSPIFG